MKFFSKHKFVIPAILLAALSVFACMTIDEIIFPDNPKVNSDIELTVKIKQTEVQTSETSKIVFGVLVPKSWKFANNATLFLTTEGYTVQSGSEVVNEQMELVSATEVEPTTAQPWATAFQAKFGVQGNTGPVEWVVFKSKTVFNESDGTSRAPMVGTIKIKLKTGPKNIKFFMGFTWAGMAHGFDGNHYKENVATKVLKVTGASGGIDDYTVLHYVSTTPNVFRYGDIFSIDFASEVDGTATGLKGTDKVYLCGTAVLSDGTKVSVTEPTDANLMMKTGDITYKKYIYPKSFFKLPSTAVISDMYVYFINADKSVVVTDGTTGFEVSQSDE